jgi:hypothetical protein
LLIALNLAHKPRLLAIPGIARVPRSRRTANTLPMLLREDEGVILEIEP